MKIGLQLISVKDVIASDLCGVIEDVGKAGYQGVEFARGFFGKTTDELKSVLDQMGMMAVGNHVYLSQLRENLQGQIDDAKTLGMHHIVALGGVSQHMGEQEIQEYIKEIRRIGQICREQGIALAVHGSTDFYQRDGGGVLLLERVLGEIAPEYLQAQIDTAWAVCAGEDPVRLIETYKDRIYTVHIKDFHPPIPSAGDIYARKEEALTRDSAVGDNGVIDLLGVIRASREAGAKWLIVEHMERESYEDSISATRVSLGNIRNTGVI